MSTTRRAHSRFCAFDGVDLAPYSDEATSLAGEMASTADAALDVRGNSAALGAVTSCTTTPTASTVHAARHGEDGAYRHGSVIHALSMGSRNLPTDAPEPPSIPWTRGHQPTPSGGGHREPFDGASPRLLGSVGTLVGLCPTPRSSLWLSCWPSRQSTRVSQVTTDRAREEAT